MIDIHDLLFAIEEYQKLRGSGKAIDCIAIADRIISRIRPMLASTNVIAAHHTASRSLWRHAKSGDLENHLAQRVIHVMLESALRRADIFEAIQFENLDDRGLPTEVPKKMVRHDARLTTLILPIKE